MSEHIYLNTTFNEKDTVKSLGARWDGTRKQWYAPVGSNLALFARWLPSGQSHDEFQNEKNSEPKPESEISENPADCSIDSEKSQLSGIGLGMLMNRVSSAILRDIPDLVWVRAEISQLRTIKGDHLAIELVEHDTEGRLTARAQSFLWKGVALKILAKFKAATGGELSSGIKVMLSVKTDFSATNGIRLIIQDIDPAYTLGDIEAKLRRIRESLSREGVIKRNQQLPSPQEFCRVAVISPDGAAGLGDFKRDADILAQAGLCEFDYVSAKFQGPDAAVDIVRCLLSLFDAHDKTEPLFDAICIIRGGGSVTDLYWLNDLELARTVCVSPVPVCTGIGHERDSTILDEIANQRFDTPSKVIGHIRDVICGNAHAAELNYQQITLNAQKQVNQAEQANDALFNQVRSQAEQKLNLADNQVEQMAAGIQPSVLRLLSETEAKLDQGMQWIESKATLLLSNAEAQLEQYQDRITEDVKHWLAVSETDVERIFQTVFQNGQQQLELANQQVEAMGREILGIGPQATLRRGFAVVRDQNGAPIVSAVQARQEPVLNIEFRDGIVDVLPVDPKEKILIDENQL